MLSDWVSVGGGGDVVFAYANAYIVYVSISVCERVHTCIMHICAHVCMCMCSYVYVYLCAMCGMYVLSICVYMYMKVM